MCPVGIAALGHLTYLSLALSTPTAKFKGLGPCGIDITSNIFRVQSNLGPTERVVLLAALRSIFELCSSQLQVLSPEGWGKVR